MATDLRRSRNPQRSVAGALAEFCGLAQQLTGVPLHVEEDGAFVRWVHGPEAWTFPASREKLFAFGFFVAVGHARWLAAKYTLGGFVEFEPGDVVVDCGSFVGGFARAALDARASVVMVEPSRTNRSCIRANLGEDVQIVEAGLGEAPRAGVPFRESSTAVDSTFGELDEGVPTETYAVDIMTIDELCQVVGIEPTFVKVEAEGMESAILAGMTQVRPAKVAVDGSGEGGSDDRPIIASRLEHLGYSVRTDKHMVYGRLIA